jgi:preprotein translocase subunit SecF
MNLGIDFAGGANVILRFQETASAPGPPRASSSDATIQQYGKADENSVLIRLPQLAGRADYAGQVVGTSTAPQSRRGRKLDLNYQGASALAELLKEVDPDKGLGLGDGSHYEELAQRVIADRSELGIFHRWRR